MLTLLLRTQYNAINGTPSCVNSALHGQLLRDQFGWSGFIVNDCHAVCDLTSR